MAFYIAIENTEITKEIRLGGVPLRLYKYDEQIVNPINSNLETVYAIGFIEKISVSSVEPENPSDPNPFEISYVWNGVRYAASQDSDGKLYFTVAQIGSTIPTDVMILEGIPIGIGESNQIAFYDSGLSENDVEDYISVTLGGVPLTAGRIGNNYYLMVYAIA